MDLAAVPVKVAVFLFDRLSVEGVSSGRFKGVVAVEGPLGSPPLLPSLPVECDFLAMVG